jgi:hypothetical protein
MSSILTLAGNNTSSGFYPHSIDQSLRGNEADSPYLSRTPSSASNRKTYTISAWIKPSLEVATFSILGAGSSGSAYYIFGMEGDDLYFEETSSGGSLRANRKLRDPSAWYHLVASVDTTQATASNRIKLYVNGVRETSFSGETYMAQDFESAYINNTSVHYIGHSPVQGSHYLNGYMSEVVFLDGVASDPTTLGLGELKDGIWVAKNVSGLTFGTNGFHLDFADSSAIGNDVSGQNNDFAVSGLVASDVVLESPTNGFPTGNPLAKSSLVTLSEGNLKVAGNSASNSGNVTVSPVVTSGKWYFEYLVAKNDGDTNYPQVQAYRSGLDEHRPFINGGTGTGGQVSGFFSLNFGLTNGDILGIAVDADGGTVKFYDNNSYISGKDIDISAYDSTGIWIGIGEYNTGFGYLNFGQDSSFAGNKTAQGNGAAHEDFFYTPPTGYKGLNLGNFDEPSIIDGSEYFNTVLYTGTGASNDISVGHATDLVWIKNRGSAYHHRLADTVRGATKHLYSSLTNAEGTDTTEVTGFGSDGFTVGSSLAVNEGSGSLVAWSWKAGTAVSGNTTGSGTAKAYSGSVNTEAGFSIITYKGNGTAGHTIPHNLGAKPSMVLFKNRDVGDQWAVYHKDILATHNLSLNLSDGKADQDNRFNDTEPTSSVMTLGTGHVVNATDEDYIAYFFTDIDQYCKAGVYTGNGSSSSGPYVYTGFSPAFVLIKNTASGGTDWLMFDNKREGYNPADILYANSSTSEETSSTKNIDILSNGFKIGASTNAGINSSGVEYIYLSFSSSPFKYSNAR